MNKCSKINIFYPGSDGSSLIKKIIDYSIISKPSNKIFEFFVEQIESGELDYIASQILECENENFIIFGENDICESLVKIFELGSECDKTENLRFGIKYTDYFDYDIFYSPYNYSIYKSVCGNIEQREKLFNGQNSYERDKAQLCIRKSFEFNGCKKHFIQNEKFKDFILYGELQGIFFQRYVYGIRKKTIFDLIKSKF